MKHKTAIIETMAIGKGTNIWHFAHIRKGVVIGKNCNIGKSVYIDTNVTVGNNTKIQNFVALYQGVTIGSNVFIGPHVCFTNDIYPRANIWNKEKIAKTIINDGVSIGANSTIVAGITIGEHAMIGAGSVVTKNVPPHALVYGNPAKVKGYICNCGTKLKPVITTQCPNCSRNILED